MAKKRITVCLRSVGASLLKRIGISGLVGAGIGLAYIICSIAAICLVLAFELQDSIVADIVNVSLIPLVLPGYVVEEIGLPGVVEVPLLVASLAIFPAVGAGIGAGVHWTRNLVKKTRASRG